MRLVEQIGLALGCLADVEIDEGLKLATEHGYKAVEICGDESFADQGLRGVWPWEEQIWSHVKPMLEPFHFKAYHAPFDGLNFLTLNPLVRSNSLEQIKTAIDIAADMGLSPVIVHPGQPRKDMDEFVLDLLVSTFLQEVATYAEEKQVRVAIESCEYFANLSTMRHYIANIDSPYLGICLDVNHEVAELNSAEVIEDFVSEFSNRLFHCRLHGMVPGQAEVNCEQIARALIEEDYQGAVIFQLVTDEIENINETRDVIYKVG